MGKILIIKDADFSRNAINFVDGDYIGIDALVNPIVTKGIRNGAYIDTGLYGTLNTKVEISFMYDTEDTDKICGVFGHNTDTFKSVSITARNIDLGSTQRFGDTKVGAIHTPKDSVNTVSIDRNRFVLNNESSVLGCDTDFTTPGTLCIFDIGTETLHPRKLFYVRIYESGTLIRNYIPVQNTQSGVCGLYDTIHSTFSPSSNANCNFTK